MFSDSSLINIFKSLKDSQRSIQTFYLGQLLTNSEETIESLLDKLSDIQKDDVIKISQRIKPHTIYFLNGKSRTEV